MGEMTKKKCILIIALSTAALLVSLFVLYYFAFRQQYFNGQKHNTPVTTDAEYLNALDMRFVSHDGDLKSLGDELTKASYDTQAKGIDKYSDIISTDNFKKLDPRWGIKTDDGMTNERFELMSSDAVSKGDKGIYFCELRYSAVLSDGSETGMSIKDCPIRVYFEKENDKWVVRNIDVPI